MSDDNNGWEDEQADGEPGGPSNKDINTEIDRLLSIHRPMRYDPSEDKDWMDSTINLVKDMLLNRMTQEQIVLDDARERVYRREGNAPKRVNTLLARIARDGQLPLGWGEPNWTTVFSEELSWPLAIKREVRGGGVKFLRIRFGVMMPADWIEWETSFRRHAEREFRARIDAADGGVFVRQLMEEHGTRRWEDYQG